jgi:demethylspheroidene O-methyltransferase
MPPEAATLAAGPQPVHIRFSAAALRDRMVASEGFRRWAARFFLTRPIARRRTRALFDLCAGFVYAQILRACLDLRLFDLLADGPLGAAVLADHMALPLDRAVRLLDAAVALKLVSRRRGGRYGLGQLGAALVGNQGVAAMVAHHAMFYEDLAEPVALLRGDAAPTRLSNYWAYARGSSPADSTPAQVAAYSELMAASQRLVSSEILDAYDVRRHRRLLDVGGGDGGFLAAAAARAPGLRLVLFDLPAVVARAAARFRAAGLDGRAESVGGSFLSDPLPTGCDLISLVRVVHDHDDAAAIQLLRAVRAALPPDGTLLLAEPMAATPGAERMGDAYFGFYLLAMGSGRPRPAGRLAEMLRDAGFGRIRAVRTSTPLLTSLIVARPG